MHLHIKPPVYVRMYKMLKGGEEKHADLGLKKSSSPGDYCSRGVTQQDFAYTRSLNYRIYLDQITSLPAIHPTETSGVYFILIV